MDQPKAQRSAYLKFAPNLHKVELLHYWHSSECTRDPMHPFLLRCAACASLVALPILSWLPAEDMVRTGVLTPGQEHFLAYMASALLLAMAVPRYRFVHVACFYAFVAGVLEAGQMYSPGRSPEVVTAVVSMAGAVMGEIVARLATGVWRKKYGFPDAFVPAPISSIPSEARQTAAE